MTSATIHLGGTASDVIVGKIAHGLMLMTWREICVPDEQCFEAIKAGVDALPPGAKMFLNAGEFYGHNLSTTNIEMLARFFEKYPEYRDRTFLSVKGGIDRATFQPDASPENLRRSVDTVNEKLRGTKRIDLFQSARVDPKVPIEESIKALVELKNEGKIDHIGMSECCAKTLRHGNMIHPISVVEIEISPWFYEEETRKVIAMAKELGITVAGYSPLGKGLLTGHIKRPEDVDDFRRNLPCFQAEAITRNFAIVDRLCKIAEKKHITPAQLSLAWVSALGDHVVPLPGSSHAKRTLENCAAGDVKLTQQEIDEINQTVQSAEVEGGIHRTPQTSGHE